MMNLSITDTYKQLIEQYTNQLKSTKQKHALVSILRLATILGVLISWFWLFSVNALLGGVLGTILFVCFLFLLVIHKKIEEKRDFLIRLLEVNQSELDCCLGTYSQFADGAEFTDTGHPYSYDMDLFGAGSLFQYLNRTVTLAGKKLLANWLQQTPLVNETILENQEAISELSNKLLFRQKFIAFGNIFHSSHDEANLIHQWLNHKPFFKHSTLVKALLYVIPAINLGLLGLVILGMLNWPVLVYITIINLAIIGLRLKRFNEVYSLLTRSHSSLKKMQNQLVLVEQLKPESRLLNKLVNKLYKDAIPASNQIKELTQLLDGLDNRNNILVGVVLNSFLLWDWQYLFRIEKWAHNHRNHYENWVETLACIDALNCLANLNYNNPDFLFPGLTSDAYQLSAVEMGHPLIQKETRVCNDFELTNQPRYAIVTGANMAGKSTFLRTVAVNLVLAGCGAPVCAKKFTFAPLPIYSSMRTEDSLMKHESYFFAELKRLQRITQELEKGKKMFIILDEILRGTNSEDKRKGSIGFVKRITEKMAYGLVATHDLELAKLVEQQPNVFKAMCFEVTLINNELQFNYKLQPGITQNMNATFLMQHMGIID